MGSMFLPDSMVASVSETASVLDCYIDIARSHLAGKSCKGVLLGSDQLEHVTGQRSDSRVTYLTSNFVKITYSYLILFVPGDTRRQQENATAVGLQPIW